MEDLEITSDEDLIFVKINSIAEELLEVLIKHQVTFAEAWRIQDRLRNKVQYLVNGQHLKKSPQIFNQLLQGRKRKGASTCSIVDK